jgi:DNA sulfur modification protein DndD
MKLISLELDNFRNFFGKHRIEFSVSSEQPLTIFIGENGAGKTTLLNAVFWAFTGKFTKMFESTFSLVNKDAFVEGNKSCSVELVFEDGDSKYRLKRSQFDSESISRLIVFQINSDGVSLPVNEALGQTYLNKFMPEKLASWFIYDGEAVDHIKLNGDTQFRADLRSTFGFSDMVSLIERLRELVRDYSRQLAALTKSQELDTLNDKIEQWNLERETREKKIVELEERIVERERIEQDATKQLMGMEQSHIIESQIERFRRLLKEANFEKNQKEKQRNIFLCKATPSSILKNKVLKLESTFKIKEKEQSLPHPFGTRLIDDIKTLKMCICGREVLPGSEAESHLHSLTAKATTGQLSQRISLLRSCLTTLKGQAEDYNEKLDGFTRDIGSADKQIADYAEIIRQAEQKLKGIPQDKIQELVRKRDFARNEQVQANQDKGYERGQLQQLDRSIRESDARRRQILAELSLNVKLKKDLEKIEKLKAYVEKRFMTQESQILSILSKEVSLALATYLTKHCYAKIDPDQYSVNVYDAQDRAMALSAGETNVLKFAVIAAIVGMAGSMTTTGQVRWITEPIIAPLIFDAPFSDNDSVYAAGISKNLSTLAGQLIFLFSSQNWNTKVSSLLQNSVGKSYLIISKAKGPKKDIQKDITIQDRNYLLNTYEAERDESYCEEVFL